MILPAAAEQVKLILSRLNKDWSISGDILSPHAEYILRRDMVSTDPMGSIRDLIEAYAHITMAAAHMLDPADGAHDAYADMHRLERWNQIYSGASNQLLFVLMECGNDKENSLLQQHLYQAFSQANAIAQLKG